jgi:hypothetical protein
VSYRCSDHSDRDCPKSCAYRAGVEEAAARAAFDASQQGRFWGLIKWHDTGKVEVTRTTWRSAAESWRFHAKYDVLDQGEGPVPEKYYEHLPAPPAVPASPAPEAQVIAGPDVPEAHPTSVTSPTTEPTPPMCAAPAPAAPAPALAAGAAAAPAAEPDPDLVNLADLEAGDDTRIASAAKRIRRFLAENARGKYRAPRFSKSKRTPPSPAGF